jgi:hypothetical protein
MVGLYRKLDCKSIMGANVILEFLPDTFNISRVKNEIAADRYW